MRIKNIVLDKSRNTLQALPGLAPWFLRWTGIFFCALACCAGSAAYSAVVLSNIEEGRSEGYDYSSVTLLGLDFSTGAKSGRIGGLSLSLLAGPSSSSQSITYSVLLYAVGANNLPTGSYLAKDSSVGATWTSSVGGSFLQQTFTYTSAQLPHLCTAVLNANSQYAIVLADNTGVGGSYWAVAATGTSYATAGGFSYLTFSKSSDDGSNWADISGLGKPMASLSFNELSPVPEPSEWAAISFGLLGIVWVLKRQFMPARA